jgi:hypothetical protein
LLEVAKDLLVAKAQYDTPDALKSPISVSVRLFTSLVNLAVHLDREPQRGAVEVDDVPCDRMLPSEAQAVEAAPAQGAPQKRFSLCGRRP